MAPLEREPISIQAAVDFLKPTRRIRPRLHRFNHCRNQQAANYHTTSATPTTIGGNEEGARRGDSGCLSLGRRGVMLCLRIGTEHKNDLVNSMLRAYEY